VKELTMRSFTREQGAPERDLDIADRPAFLRRVFIVGGVALAFFTLYLLARAAVDVLLLAFAGVLFAVILRSLANLIADHTPLGPRTALAVVVLALLLALGLGGWALAGQIAEQTDQLVVTVPETLRQGADWLRQYSWGEWLLGQAQDPAQLPWPTDLIGNVRSIFSTTAGAVAGVVIVLFLGLYLAIEPRLYIRGLLSLLPPSRRNRGREVLSALGHTLQWWLLSKLLAMVVIGVLTTVGLSLLGVPLALALGLIAALLSFIPNLGPTLATVPTVLLALQEGPVRAAQVLGLYLAIQAVESYMLTPYIERKTVALPPALTLIIQVALGVLVGSLGLILAAPLVAAGLVLVRMLYIEDVLGDRSHAQAG
jgi:predicted PurR-regulated permease PerM